MENNTNVLTKEYMDWLVRFSDQYPVFADFTFWNVSDDVVAYEEKKNISRIFDLYDEVKKYAERNFIPSINKKNGISYEIIYNGIGFCLTETFDRDINMRCYRESLGEMDFPIDFYDVQNNVVRKDRNQKIRELNTLEMYINSLLNEGIPSEEIKNTVNNTLNNRKIRKLKK